MKKLLCKLFGHTISGSTYSHYPGYERYMTCGGGVTDGIGRQHISLYSECDRCGEKYKIGSIHGDKNGKITK